MKEKIKNDRNHQRNLKLKTLNIWVLKWGRVAEQSIDKSLRPRIRQESLLIVFEKNHGTNYIFGLLKSKIGFSDESLPQQTPQTSIGERGHLKQWTISFRKVCFWNVKVSIIGEFFQFVFRVFVSNNAMNEIYIIWIN